MAGSMETISPVQFSDMTELRRKLDQDHLRINSLEQKICDLESEFNNMRSLNQLLRTELGEMRRQPAPPQPVMVGQGDNQMLLIPPAPLVQEPDSHALAEQLMKMPSLQENEIDIVVRHLALYDFDNVRGLLTTPGGIIRVRRAYEAEVARRSS
jgi:TolA-binding protein